MPKLKSKTLTAGKQSVDINVYYFEAKSKHDDPIFFAALVDPKKWVSDLSEGKINNHHSRGTTYKGGKGSTEAEAVSKLQEYLNWFVSMVEKKEPLLFIKNGKQAKRKQRYWDSEPDKNKADVTFEFFNGYRLATDGITKYFKDKDYHDINSSYSQDEIWGAEDEFTIIPFTPEKLAACEGIVSAFRELQKKIDGIFQKPEQLEQVLNGQVKLLGQDSPQA